jgi:hypothetical protein
MPQRRVGNITTRPSGTGGLGLEWDTRVVLSAIEACHLEAMQRVAVRARKYWDTEEWTPDHHPYMTGDEDSIKANGYFEVVPNPSGTLALYIGSTSGHTIYEELGTSRQPAHQPIRNTVDRVAYSISDELRASARRHGLS